MRRPRAASCMRLLDQTRQQRPKTLLWCKGRPSARPPRRPSANLCDRSDSGFFALEGNPHQPCLAMIEHPRRAKGLGDGRPADDSRPRTKSPRLAPAAPPRGARCRRLPLGSATPLASNGGCDATGAAGPGKPERHSKTNAVQRRDCENRTPTPQPDFFLTQRNASVLSNGWPISCGRRRRPSASLACYAPPSLRLWACLRRCACSCARLPAAR